MKRGIGLLLLAACLSFSASPVYDFSITMPNGAEKSLSDYSGKNMMIIILPSVRTDSNTALLQQLDTLQRQFADSLVMIGVPAYEDGYADDSLDSVIAWYYSILDSSFVVGQGMNTAKASPYQSTLFHWLTHADENGHFDQDAMGAGEKFFVNKEGLLHGLVSPEAPFDSDVIIYMLSDTP